MSKMIIAESDGWIGIYVNGDLITEDHSIQPHEAVDIAIEYDVTEVEREYVNQDWMDDLGAFPRNIKDVKWENEDYVSHLTEEDDTL